ncbi:MAG: carbohydrate ABC transporter permease [Lachnospiraceae bacterium]|mgnify:CR=1 FL=1|nr:carbohydrate ABC transporter permease [Lachnospiraceae bacterium]
MPNSKKSRQFQLLINIVMMVIVLTVVLPFLLVFISSITDENVLIRNGYSFFPQKISLYAYQYIIGQGGKILRAYGVTIFVTFVGTALNLAMSALLAYPLSIKTLPYRRAITFFVFFTMLFNGGLVPTYLMYVNYFHIKNTLWALIVPNLLLSANNVLMIRSYFITSIPEALFEAAKIDGAGHMKIFTVLALPLGKPILVTMGLFSGLAYWNDWTNGLYYLSGNNGQKLYSIQNLLNQMITNIQYLSSGKVAGNIGAEVAKLPATSIRMAIAFIAMLPLFVIYPFLQKYFAEGITLGAVKG